MVYLIFQIIQINKKLMNKKGIIFMKKVCTFLIALLLILSSLAIGTEQSEAASFRTVKVVNGSSLVVKAFPTTSASTVTTLSRGDFVTVFSTSNGWASIQSGNVRGYVNASFLATPPSTIKIASSISGLVVKATPFKSAPTSAILKYNMIVEDFGPVGGGWSFVQYGNVTGYVASTFIGKPKTSTKYVNTASGVVVRNIASSSGANTGTLANKTQVTVHSTIAGWSYVTSGSTKGYVVDSFLSTNQLKGTVSVAGGLAPKVGLKLTYYPTFTDNSQREYTVTKESDGNKEYISLNYKGNFSGGYSYQESSSRIMLGVNETDWFLFDLAYPMVEGKQTKSYYIGENWEEYFEYVNVESTTSTVTVKAGTFKNVVIIRYSTGAADYFAPGYGIIKTVDPDGKIVTELISVQ